MKPEGRLSEVNICFAMTSQEPHTVELLLREQLACCSHDVKTQRPL